MTKADKSKVVACLQRSLDDIEFQLKHNYGPSSRITLNTLKLKVETKLEGLR